MASGPTKADLEQELELLKRKHAAFRTDVREIALTTAREQGWCVSGLNEALTDLDLPVVELKRKMRVTLELDLEVNLEDWDGALDMDERDLICDIGADSHYRWHVTFENELTGSDEDVSISDVTADLVTE